VLGIKSCGVRGYDRKTTYLLKVELDLGSGLWEMDGDINLNLVLLITRSRHVAHITPRLPAPLTANSLAAHHALFRDTLSNRLEDLAEVWRVVAQKVAVKNEVLQSPS